jgi:phosphinothricin acetyltransferase
MPNIRPATTDDLPEILAIYNEVIANSTAVYTETPVSLADRQAWFEARRQQGFPVLVAGDAGDVLGFASFGDFRAWPCYRYSVEHSVHIRADARGRGLGAKLVEALLAEAQRLGKHVLIAGVDAANHASLRFHERLGFEPVGQFREVGYKFNRWLDLVFLQRMIEAAAPP